MLSERRRWALLFVFFSVFVFFANDTKGDDDGRRCGKRDFPERRRLESFFVSPVSSKMERKSDDFDFFSRFFGQTTPQKVAAAAAFWQDHSEQKRGKRERDTKKTKKCQHSKHTASQKSVLEDWWIIYTYIQLPLCKGEILVPASRRVLLRFYDKYKASPRAFHSDLRFLKIFLFSHGM